MRQRGNEAMGLRRTDPAISSLPHFPVACGTLYQTVRRKGAAGAMPAAPSVTFRSFGEKDLLVGDHVLLAVLVELRLRVGAGEEVELAAHLFARGLLGRLERLT